MSRSSGHGGGRSEPIGPACGEGDAAGVSALRLEVLEAMAAGQRLGPVMDLLCHRIEALAPGRACAILRLDSDGRLHAVAGPGLPSAYLAAIDGVIAGFASNPGQAAGASPIDLVAAPGWAEFRAVPRPPGRHACWAWPIAADMPGALGVVALFGAESAAAEAGERQLMARCAHLCALAFAQDAARARTEQTQQRLELALNRMSQGLCFYDGSQRLVFANRRYAEIYGIRPEQIVPGMSIYEVIALRNAAGSGPAMTQQHYADWRDTLRRKEDLTDTVLELANGKVIALHHQPMPDKGWVAIHEDITDRSKVEPRLVHLARHDPLTGLANRTLFRERLEQTLAQSSKQQMHAVLCLDLDRFKPVNDSFGHAVGDQLLQAVAGRIEGCVREIDTVTRLGGDEFAIFAVALNRAEAARDLAQRIVRVFAEPFQAGGHLITIGASLGIALSPADGNTAEDLLQSAQVALHRAKRDQRGTYRFFEADMQARLQSRLSLERELRRGLQLQQFELYYQPLIDLERGAICAFEALIRWHHPEKGLVPPDQFIPLAEETGLIVPLGAWVLRQACAEAVGWPADVTVSVNLSPAQFKCKELARTVHEALSASGLPANRLELEITESVLLEDSAATLATLRELSGLGTKISMDDFGTGYSSLSYLRRFPFDKIKIDQSFTQDLNGRLDSIAIVRAIVGLGRSLNMVTTAEGVETEEQLAWLREEGCNEVQGYLFSRPRPASEVPAMLAARHFPATLEAQPAPAEGAILAAWQA